MLSEASASVIFNCKVTTFYGSCQ